MFAFGLAGRGLQTACMLSFALPVVHFFAKRSRHTTRVARSLYSFFSVVTFYLGEELARTKSAAFVSLAAAVVSSDGTFDYIFVIFIVRRH